MPMVPVSAFFMLACARIGAIHSVVFGGFAAKELASRIEDCSPKLIVTASCGLEPGKVIKYRPIVEEALKHCTHIADAEKSIKRIIVQRKTSYEDKNLDKDLYYDYDALMDQEEELAECVPVEANHPLYILCTFHMLKLTYFRYIWYNRATKRNRERYWWNSRSSELDNETHF